jgi:hypothetical protein
VNSVDQLLRTAAIRGAVPADHEIAAAIDCTSGGECAAACRGLRAVATMVVGATRDPNPVGCDAVLADLIEAAAVTYASVARPPDERRVAA